MVFSGWLFNGNEFHANICGALGEVARDAFAVALLEVVLPLVGIFLAFGQHRVDQPCQLVGRRGDGLGSVHARAHAPEIRAQGRFDATQRGSGQPQSLVAWLTTRFVLPLITLPPVILVPGHRPSQLAKCPTVGQRDMSDPVSEITASAVVTSMPSIRVRSTPHILKTAFGDIAGFVSIVAIVMSLVGMFRLASGLGYSNGAKIGRVILLLVPLVGLITLLVLNLRATEALWCAGCKVGQLER